MEVVVKHLQRDKATGILSYRRRFPKELAQYIPSGRPTDRGRTELKVSLRATSLDNAAAKDRLAEAERQYEDIVSRARKMAAGQFDPLDDATIPFHIGRGSCRESVCQSGCSTVVADNEKKKE